MFNPPKREDYFSSDAYDAAWYNYYTVRMSTLAIFLTVVAVLIRVLIG